MKDFGTEVNDGGKSIRFQHLLPGPIDKVWEHISKPTKDWLATASIELRRGGTVDLYFDSEEVPERKEGGAHIIGVVTECAPPTVLAYTWNDADHPVSSDVRFELEAEGEQVRLFVVHAGLAADAVTRCTAGWQAHISLLVSVLNGVVPKPFPAVYRELQRLHELEKTLDSTSLPQL